MIPACGAKAKSTGKPCLRYPCKNGRCHLHGGHCKGAKTKSGKMRQKMASWKHGCYSKESLQERKEMRSFIQLSQELIK